MLTRHTQGKRLSAAAGIALMGALMLGLNRADDADATRAASVPAAKPAAVDVAQKAARPAAPKLRRQFSPAVNSRCDAASASPGSSAYNYPIKPFKQQHPIRGYFGDPRTQALRHGNYTPGGPGPFNLHQGIDIVAATGTDVYPVVSGVAHLTGEYIGVTTADGREFRYYHISFLVRSGQRVVAYRTVLGRTLPHFNHVHLSELVGGQLHNPLDPGHLTPYRDSTQPQVDSLRFTTGEGGRADPLHLRGSVTIAAESHDMPALPIVGNWPGLGVTPALVQWSLRVPGGRAVVPWRTASDARLTHPSDRDYWKVFASGTHQNKYGESYPARVLVVGEYFSSLTTSGSLDTRNLPNGTYVLSVRVADTCGNAGSLSERITLDN